MRKLAVFMSIIVFFGTTFIFIVGSLLSSPNQVTVGNPPPDLNAQAVSIDVPKGNPILGWYSDSYNNQGGILLLHSVRSNRTEMIERARFLKEAGYSVLLIDMQAHGESKGSHITFGHLESIGVRHAIDYLRSQLPGQPIGIIGVSLGGAATLLGDVPINVDAVVLEAVYSSIDMAVKNRLEIRLGTLGRQLAPLLLWQIEPRLGISRDHLAPLEAISTLSSPVMIIGGSNDRHTFLSETLTLFSRANKPKQLWVIEGAEHQNLHRHSKKVYEAKILSFFKTHFDRENTR